MLTHPIPPIGADLKARVKATPPYRVSIGVAGAISVTDDPESEKIRGAEITVVPKYALATFLFLARGAEFFRKSDVGETTLFVVLDRRDLLAIGTLRGRKLQEPSNLG